MIDDAAAAIHLVDFHGPSTSRGRWCSNLSFVELINVHPVIKAATEDEPLLDDSSADVG